MVIPEWVCLMDVSGKFRDVGMEISSGINGVMAKVPSEKGALILLADEICQLGDVLYFAFGIRREDVDRLKQDWEKAAAKELLC